MTDTLLNGPVIDGVFFLGLKLSDNIVHFSGPIQSLSVIRVNTGIYIVFLGIIITQPEIVTFLYIFDHEAVLLPDLYRHVYRIDQIDIGKFMS